MFKVGKTLDVYFCFHVGLVFLRLWFLFLSFVSTLFPIFLYRVL